MPSFQIDVSANVDSYYGATVYAVAVRAPEEGFPDITDSQVLDFFAQNKASLTAFQQTVPKDPTNATVAVSGAVPATNIFNQLDEGRTVETIPHAFVDYQVFVCVENELGLKSVADAGKHNGYNVSNLNEITLNQFTGFVDGQPENSLTVSSNIHTAFSGTTGDQVLYATMAFVDSNTTDEQAHWYLDQALKPNSTIVPQGELFSETVEVPFVAPSHVMTQVIESVDYGNVSSTLVDVHDVNAFKIFIVTKKLASNGETALSGIGDNHLGTTTDYDYFNGDGKAHARVKQVRVTDSGDLSVDLTGFSAGAAPTEFKFLPVVHGETFTGEVSALGQSVAIVGGAPNKVYSQTVEWTKDPGAFDPAKEYDVLVVLETADSTQNSDVARLDANLQDPVISGTKQILSDTAAPHATVSDVVFNGTGSITGQVTLTGHPFVTVPGSTKVELALTTTSDAVVAAEEFLFNTTTEGSAVAFSISTTAEGYDVDAVNHLFLRGKVTTQDQSYTFTKDLGAVSELTRAAPDNSALFAKFGTVSMSYDDITANVISVFNNSDTDLTEVYVGLTEGGVPLNAITDLSNFTQHTVSVPANEVATLNQDFVLSSAVNLPLEHRITVPDVNLSGGDYSFSPAVPEFIKEHRYVFDNTANPGHPLYFSDTANGAAVYSQDADGIVVVENFGTSYTKLFAKCSVIGHENMGDIVNNGTTGISVVDPSTDPSFVLDINKKYFVNVCTASGVVHSSAEFTPDASGVTLLTVGFHPSSGNIEVTGGSLNIKDANDELKLIAFTDARADPLAFAGSAAVVAVPQTTLGLVSVSSVFIDQIIDSADEVHDASDTRNAYIYSWVENSVSKKRSAVRESNVLNPADRLYPKIDNVTYVTDRLVIAPGDLSIVNADSNIAKFHVLALANNYTPGDYSQLLSESNETDLVPDQAANDIFVNTENVDLTLKFTGEIGPGEFTTASIGPGDEVKVVLVAVAVDGSTKAFEYTREGVTSGVPGIYGTFTAAYSSNKGTIVFGAGVEAEGDGKVRVAASTVPLADPTGSTDFVESTLAITSKTALSDILGLTITRVNNDTADVSDTNKVYLYAWVHNNGTNSAVAQTTVSHSPETSFYQRVSSDPVVSDGVSVDASFQATQEAIDRYYVAVVKNGVTVNATMIKASVIQTNAVHAFGPLGLGQLAKLSGLSFANALTDTDTVEPFGPGSSYKVVLLAENDTGSISELVESPVFSYATFGVKSISNVSISATDGTITFDVSTDGFPEGGAAVIEARAYTRSQTGAIGTVNQLVSGSSSLSVPQGASGASFTGLVLESVTDSQGALVNPRYVNEVHIYAWLKQGITKSDIHHKEYKQSTTAPYPGLHDAIVVPGVNTIQGTVSVFDDATEYYLGAFLGEKVAGKSDQELYNFFVNHGTVKSIEVQDGQVFFTAEEIPTVYNEPFVNPTKTTAVLLDTRYTVVMIALGGTYSVARRDGLISSSTTPYINNMEVAYNADTVSADITQIDLHVPANHSETVSFYAAATTYPVTSVSAPSPASVPYAARVTLASRLDATATGVVIPNAFPKVMDLTGDLVDFASVKTAYAYAWAQGDTTGNVHPIHIAANGFDHPGTFPKLSSVSVDPVDLTLTVNAATLFSAEHNLMGYRIFAMKDPIATDPAAVQTFVSTGVLDSNTDFTAQRYTALGEYYEFPTPVAQDDLFEVPGYMAVMTKAFTSTGDALQTEDITGGNSYKVYLAVKDSSDAWTLHAYPNVLFVSSEYQSVALEEATALATGSETNTLTNTGGTLAVSITETTETSGVYAYNTGIQIDLVNDAGTEIWFDFTHISTNDYYYLLPAILDPSVILDVSWGLSSSVKKYAAGNFIIYHASSSVIYNNTRRVGYNGYEGLNADAGVNVSGLFDTHYAVLKVLDTEGTYAGLKEVQYQVYNNPQRKQEHLIATMDMSYFTTTYGGGAPPTISTFVMGIIHKGKAPSFTLSNFKTNKADSTVAQVGAVKNVTFDNSVQNYHTVSFGLDSVTASSTENSDIYAAVFTRDLKYEKHATSVGGYLNEIYSAESKLEPILSVPAGTSVSASDIQAQEAVTAGWVLLHRDVFGQYVPSSIQNVNEDTAKNDFGTNYSLLGDLKNGTGNMTDAYVKSDGKYRFRFVPYLASDTTRLPGDNTERYIEWTQTSNPTTSAGTVSDYVLVGNTPNMLSSSFPFGGLTLNTSHPDFTWIDGNPDIINNTFWYLVGQIQEYGDATNFAFAYGTTYENTQVNELWVWSTKVTPAKPNPFSLDQAIDTNGDLVDLYTVNTGHLYVWARTLGDTVDARSKVQRVDQTSTPQGPYQLWMYMLNDSDYTYADSNLLSVVRIYDTHDAWNPNSPTTEQGEVLGYDIDYLNVKNEDISLNGNVGDSLTSSMSGGGLVFYDNSASDPHDPNKPILKLGNISSTVKSVYVAWYRPKYAFDFRLELRDVSGNAIIYEYEDRTKTALADNGTGYGVINEMLSEAHGKWNIPQLSGEVPGVYQTGPTNKAIQTNAQNPTATFANVTLSATNEITWMLRFKMTARGTDPMLFRFSNPTSGFLIGMQENTGQYRFVTNTLDSNKMPLSNNTWYTAVCRVLNNSQMRCYINNTDLTSSGNTSTYTTFDITNMEMNERTVFDEIDYFVIVPDALTEAQMQSLYTNYNEGQDIAGFLAANGLSPTVNYQFNGDNTNAGSASGLPAISFQATDVYTDYTTQTLVQASKNVLVPPPVVFTTPQEYFGDDLSLSFTRDLWNSTTFTVGDDIPANGSVTLGNGDVVGVYDDAVPTGYDSNGFPYVNCMGGTRSLGNAANGGGLMIDAIDEQGNTGGFTMAFVLKAWKLNTNNNELTFFNDFLYDNHGGNGWNTSTTKGLAYNMRAYNGNARFLNMHFANDPSNLPSTLDRTIVNMPSGYGHTSEQTEQWLKDLVMDADYLVVVISHGAEEVVDGTVVTTDVPTSVTMKYKSISTGEAVTHMATTNERTYPQYPLNNGTALFYYNWVYDYDIIGKYIPHDSTEYSDLVDFYYNKYNA